MRCPSCGHDNLPEARFCALCGVALVTAVEPPQVEDIIPSADAGTAAVLAETPLRISVFSASVGLLILGLIAGWFLFRLPWLEGYGELPFAPLPFNRWGLVGAFSPWLATGAGVAAALWLSARFQLTGRLPAALGMAFILVEPAILVFSAVGWVIDDVGLETMIYYAIVGLGVGFLFPLAFWRRIIHVSPVGRVVLAIAAIVGLVAGWYWYGQVGLGSAFVPAVVALFIGLPSVLISPIVR